MNQNRQVPLFTHIQIGNQKIILRKLTPAYFEKLHQYLHDLSDLTRIKFEPHSFDLQTVIEITSNTARHQCYVAIEEETDQIIAYTIIKVGVFEYDVERYKLYHINLSNADCFTFAPSVADAWQGKGIGIELFKFLLNDLQRSTLNKMILWGGVQSLNHHAIKFYTKMGFTAVGQFEYNGTNVDMMLSW